MIARARVELQAVYVAIERWVAGRVVVVVAPHDAEGPRWLEAAGARVIVVSRLADDDAEVRRRLPKLPLADASAHIVACLDGYARFDAEQRKALVSEARRVLAADGLLVLASAREDAGVDFWTLEREAAASFAWVQMIAQMPWRGASFAPVLEHEPSASIQLCESLLSEQPQVVGYLAIAGGEAARARQREAQQSLLVPFGGDCAAASVSQQAATHDGEVFAVLQAEVGQLRAQLVDVRACLQRSEQEVLHGEASVQAVQAELAEARAAAAAELAAATLARRNTGRRIDELTLALSKAVDQLRVRDNDLAVLGASLQAVELTAARNGERADALVRALEERNAALARMQAQLEVGAMRHDQLARQLESALVEREELHQRIAELERIAESARLRPAVAEAEPLARVRSSGGDPTEVVPENASSTSPDSSSHG